MKNTETIQNFNNRLLFAIGVSAVFLFAFTIYKALNASFTHDEFTLLSYAERSYYGIFIIDPPYAGCHILLTFLVKPIITLFGISEFTLRLPTLIGHLIYLIFTYRLVVLLHRNNWVVFCTWLLLNANPYLLDFFAIGRGYGLAIAMMMVSCYYFLRFVKENGTNTKYLFGAFFAGFLAVYTNFTLLNYYVALLGTWGLYVLYHLWKTPNFSFQKALKIHWVVPIVTLFMAAIIYIPLKRLVETDQFYFAGMNGFWQDTVRSLAESYMYGMPYGIYVEFVTSMLFTMAFLVTLALLFFHWTTQKEASRDWAFTAMISIFSLAMLSTIVQFHTIGTKYLFARIALFYLPLLFISFSFFLQYAVDTVPFKKYALFLIGVLNIFVAYHSIRACNTHTYRDWWYDKNSKGIMEYLRDEVTPAFPDDERINVGLKWIYVPSFYFYEKKWNTENHINLVNKINPKLELTPDLDLDYIYTEQNDLEILKESFDWEVVFEFPNQGVLLK
ncbi:MAG: hypothetical protein ACPG49_13745, partial [Chitinophagales bacterium]